MLPNRALQRTAFQRAATSMPNLVPRQEGQRAAAEQER